MAKKEYKNEENQNLENSENPNHNKLVDMDIVEEMKKKATSIML